MNLLSFYKDTNNISIILIYFDLFSHWKTKINLPKRDRGHRYHPYVTDFLTRS